MSDFPTRLHALRKKLGLTQSGMAERMGLSMSYVHQLEAGKRTPSDSVETLVRILESQAESDPVPADAHQDEHREDVRTPRYASIPVIGWAHAGEAASYDELPKSWQRTVPTECHDEKAFAVQLEGESMEPRFREGDILVVMPNEEAYSGCYVIARFVHDGVVFRRLERSGERIQLVPLNERYQVTEHGPEEFSWIYPVWGRWSQLWKR